MSSRGKSLERLILICLALFGHVRSVFGLCSAVCFCSSILLLYASVLLYTSALLLYTSAMIYTAESSNTAVLLT